MVEEYNHIRGEYEAQLVDKIFIDREFVDHNSNLTLFEISATFDMLRLNLPIYVLPDLAVNIIDTIASIRYCFVCERNDMCNYSHKEGLCKECFYDKYENKCMCCNKNKRKYGEGLCKGCYDGFYEKFDNKLCVDCNKNKRKFKGGLCKGCHMKKGNVIITKKCVNCNTNQAKCKGGLCRGC